MFKSRPAALLRGATLAVAASALLAPAAHAAGPVITGLDSYWKTDFGPDSLTISGSGFTGGTVSISGVSGVQTAVVSDHTIIATYRSGSSSPHTVQVSGSAITPLSQFRTPVGPADGSVAVTCRIGAAGAPFDGTFVSEFRGTLPAASPPDTSVDLGQFWAHLELPKRDSGVADPLASVVGDATVTSIDADVSGPAAQHTIDLAEGSTPYSFPVATSVDGNRLAFEIAHASASSTLDLLPKVGQVSVALRGYHASVTLAGGATSSLDCLPKTSAASLLSFASGVPAPTIDGVSATSGPTTGGTRLRFTGSGFYPGMFVRFGMTPAASVNVISSTELEAVTPPRPAGLPSGMHAIEIGSAGGATDFDDFTFVGSSNPAPLTRSIPLTCTAAGGSAAAHPTLVVHADVQPSAVPGEGLGLGVISPGGDQGPGELTADVVFSPADVDALRTVRFASNYAHLYLPLTIAGTTHAGDTIDDYYLPPGAPGWLSPDGPSPIPTGLFGGRPAGTGATLTFDLDAYDLGVVDASAGGAVTVDLRPFAINEWSTRAPLVNCSPGAASEIVRIPVGGSDSPQPVDLNLGLAGTLTVKSLAKGTAALKGSLQGSLTGNAFAGNLALSPVIAKLTAYGVIPVTAAFQFAPVGQTTGTLTDGTLTTASQVLVKVPALRVFGLSIVNSGCQAKTVSEVNLTAPGFSTAAGGTLTGTLPIRGLTGCGANTNIASNALTSTANALTLKATPIAPAAS